MRIFIKVFVVFAFASLVISSNAEPFSNQESSFSVVFPSYPQKAIGTGIGFYGPVPEICFVATNSMSEIFIVTIHDYRKYTSQAELQAKVVDFTVNNSVFKNNRADYEEVSLMNITAPETMMSKMLLVDHSEKRYHIEKKTQYNREYTDIRKAVPYDNGVLYARSLLRYEKGILYWVQAMCYDPKRSISADHALFMSLFEIL